MIKKAQEILADLTAGNRRFVSGVRSVEALASQIPQNQAVDNPSPAAVILGCSDSRVPAEIVFDQGLGSLFVIRVAGNIVAPSQIGSVEFAVGRYGTPLVVVLGHSSCNAVMATIEALNNPNSSESDNVLSIVNRIKPAIKPLFDTALIHDQNQLLHLAIRANIRATTNHLRHGSSILERLIHKNELTIVGAEYDLQTGEVDFFDQSFECHSKE